MSTLSLYEIRNMLSSGKSIYDLPLSVTFYARVSTDKYEQLNSLGNQVKYFEDYIKENPNWKYVKGYIEEGITGTSTKKRDAFKEMIRDAKDGKFNLILTKEISRFARDTLDSLTYTRELLENGVGVFFETDNINTFDPDSEMRLTMMSSIAQEEVRKLSERVKFGFQRQIGKGSVLGNDSIWGYEKDKTVKKDDIKKLVIVESEAKIIRKIFDMYVNEHIGMKNIGVKLADEGIFNKNGKPFAQSTIKYILTNPKYKGYYCGNRTRIVDYHTKQRINIDVDDWKLYEAKEIIPPIVDEAIWDKAQEIIKSRSDKYAVDKKVYQNRYPFSGKIFCMKHNTTYRRKVNISSGIKKKRLVTWRCSNFLKYNTEGCNGPILYEEELKEIVGKEILKYVANVEVIDELISEYKSIEESRDYAKDIKKKKEEKEKVENEKERLLNLLIKELISEDEYKRKRDELLFIITDLSNEILEMENKRKDMTNNYKYLEKARKRALEKLEYENADIDNLIWEFLEKIEVCDSEKDSFKLNIILNTGNSSSINLNDKKRPFSNNNIYSLYRNDERPFSNNYAYDQSRC